jgi:hypothetical protein
MPDSDAIPDRIVLAAIRRAQLHSGNPGGVSITAVKAHLGLPHNAWTTRQVRPLLEALIASGAVEPGRRQSHDVYAITAAGRRRAASFKALPESPQHQDWRRARALAGVRMGEFRRDMREALTDARRLLGAGADSATWAEMTKRLQRAARRLSSATYCLREWPEPNDATADIADPELRGRRNTLLWED